MARKRKLEAPSADDLSALEEQFLRETSPRGPLAAPIAQVASEAAQAADMKSAEQRAQALRNKTDAERLRAAETAGRLIVEVPLEEIDEATLIRDRMSLDPDELEELKRSIVAHGLRLPIEVYELGQSGGFAPSQGKRYGLLSGYRRFRAVAELGDLWTGGRYGTISAIVRDPEELGGTFVAMVEENEVRANLSHYERGRIAVLAAKEGAFPNTEAAVDALFGSASRAKRSKVRSFALIFEELGDMLQFPEYLREKDGLRLASVLRAGGEDSVRKALADDPPETAEEELGLLTKAMALVEPRPTDPKRGGRPAHSARQRTGGSPEALAIDLEQQGEDWIIRVSGRRIDPKLLRAIVDEIEVRLQRN